MFNKKRIAAALAAILLLLAGCGQTAAGPGQDVGEETGYVEQFVMLGVDLVDEAVALSESPAALCGDMLPVASGTAVKKNDKASIDYSNTKDGYIMVNFTASTSKRLKVRVQGPSAASTKINYDYNITPGMWTTIPLSDGNGEYKITVYEHTGKGNTYATVLSLTTSVKLADEFAPFLRPNQYVDYTNATKTIAKAQELAGGESEPLKKVEKIYDFVVKNLTYDKERAASVKSGYLPVLDSVLAEKKGICFDYAALMTGMLRSQGIPCKLVVGYAGEAYHAWISVWSEGTGWIDGAIYFDGSVWQRMDPTFASSGKGSDTIMKFIGDGSNYTEQKLY